MARRRKEKSLHHHGIPALLSFIFPGIGQFVKGDAEKGIVHFLLGILAWMSMMIMIGMILVPVIHIYSAYDAYQ